MNTKKLFILIFFVSVFYDPLPLYHSAGGVVGIGLMMIFGATVVIRQKFSVRNFWQDCIKYDCNVSHPQLSLFALVTHNSCLSPQGAQYIGEICRYLLSAPQSPEDRSHNVEIMWGNGLRPSIWQQFQERFGVKFIGEFYGATEGNSNVLNIDSKMGSVGFTSVLLPFVYPVSLIRVDEEGEIVRDARGLCIKCRPGEPGEFVGKIVMGHPARDFQGYVDKVATSNKIIADVFRKGDMYFRYAAYLLTDAAVWGS